MHQVAREWNETETDLGPFVAQELKHLEVVYKLEDLKAEIELARKMADRVSDPHLKQHAQEAADLVTKVEKDQALDAEGLQSLIHQVHESLNHEHPEMRKYTRHLVGHAHIDFQWLWEWPETIQVCHDTFGQAIKFMKEYAQFDPACLILQGFDFERATLADMEALRQLAGEFNVEMWMSAQTHRGAPSNEHGIPEPVAKLASAIAVIVQMADHSDGVHVSLLKDHDNPNVAKLTLALDPSTMLLVKK